MLVILIEKTRKFLNFLTLKCKNYRIIYFFSTVLDKLLAIYNKKYGSKNIETVIISAEDVKYDLNEDFKSLTNKMYN